MLPYLLSRVAKSQANRITGAFPFSSSTEDDVCVFKCSVSKETECSRVGKQSFIITLGCNSVLIQFATPSGMYQQICVWFVQTSSWGGWEATALLWPNLSVPCPPWKQEDIFWLNSLLQAPKTRSRIVTPVSEACSAICLQSKGIPYCHMAAELLSCLTQKCLTVYIVIRALLFSHIMSSERVVQARSVPSRWNQSCASVMFKGVLRAVHSLQNAF